MRHLWLEATPHCNARCLYCYNVWRAPGYTAEEPRRKTLEQVLERSLEALVPGTLTLSGGEPLLRHDLEDLADRAKALSPGLEIQLTTNGTLMTRARARRLREAGVSHVLIPLLSDRRETQGRLMGLDTFDAACRALLAAREAGLVACAVFVATRLNLAEMEGSMRTALALGADEWMFLRYLPGGTGLSHPELGPEPEALAGALEAADRLGESAGLSVTCGEPLPWHWLEGRRFGHVRFARCGAGSERLAVDPAGNVRPCEQDPRILGNVLDPGFRLEEPAHPACSGCHLVDRRVA